MDAEVALEGSEADEEELCRVLQAHARTLEQREMSQMRQGAILQKKLDTVEQQLRELRQRQEVDREEAARALRNKQQAQSTESDQRVKEAARVLEMELQQSLESSQREAKDVERNLKATLARRNQLQSDLDYWRRCAQELLQEGSREQASAKETDEVAARVQELRQHSTQMSSEVDNLRRSCNGFGDQISELEKIADATRVEEVQVQQRNQALRASIGELEVETSRTRARAAAELRREQALRDDIASLGVQLLREQEAYAQHAASGSSEEVAYLRRKVEEKEKEAGQLQQEQSRLQAALQRHAGPAIHQRQEPGLDSDFSGACGAFDETVSRFVTLLFKSICVRRLFCGHLLVLYSWLFFLLWWMSGGANSFR
jgi:hypothetical protein